MNSAQLSAILMTLLLSGILPLDALAQAGGGPSATGQAILEREGGEVRVSFNAVTTRDGLASGQIDFYDPFPLPEQDVDGTGDLALAVSRSGVALQAVVNCLAVDSGTAIVGGEVTHSNIPRYLGKQVLLFVEDSAKSGGRFSWGFYERQANVFCDSYPWAAYTPVTIAQGTLQIRE